MEAAASFVLELDNARKSREHEHGSPDEGENSVCSDCPISAESRAAFLAGQRSRRLPPVAYLALIDYYSVIGDVDSSVEILSSLANRRDVDHGLITGHVGRVTQAVCDHKGIEEAITVNIVWFELSLLIFLFTLLVIPVSEGIDQAGARQRVL